MRQKQEELEIRTLEEARYIIDNHATVRQTAKQFSISKTTVHKDMSERLPNYSFTLAEEVSAILDENKAERALRGGLATREKYLSLKKANLI